MATEGKSDDHDGDDGDYEDDDNKHNDHDNDEIFYAMGLGVVQNFIFSASVCSSWRDREACVSQNKFPHDFKVD